MRFDGKVVLVSGAGSGIGRATALGFAERGARVGVADIDAARAEAVAEEITKAGGVALAIAADAGAPAGIEAMIGGTVKAFGGLDILHNNAFGQPALPDGQRRLAFLGDLDERVWTHTIDLGPDRRLPRDEARHPRAARAGRRRHREHRVDLGVVRRLRHRRLQHGQGRRDQPHAGGRHRVRLARDPRELRVPGRDRHAAAAAVAVDPGLRRGDDADDSR